MKRTPQVEQALLSAGKHYAAAYMLMTIAVDHIDEGDTALKSINLFRGDTKMMGNRVQKDFDRFCQHFQKFLSKGDDKVVLQDWERLTPAINEVLDLNL